MPVATRFIRSGRQWLFKQWIPDQVRDDIHWVIDLARVIRDEAPAEIDVSMRTWVPIQTVPGATRFIRSGRQWLFKQWIPEQVRDDTFFNTALGTECAVFSTLQGWSNSSLRLTQRRRKSLLKSRLLCQSRDSRCRHNPPPCQVGGEMHATHQP